MTVATAFALWGSDIYLLGGPPYQGETLNPKPKAFNRKPQTSGKIQYHALNPKSRLRHRLLHRHAPSLFSLHHRVCLQRYLQAGVHSQLLLLYRLCLRYLLGARGSAVLGVRRF